MLVNWFRRFMMGRYGVDQLSFAMLLLSCLLAMFTRGRLWPLSLVGLAVMALAYYRVPRGRGNIVITCPKCHREFTKRT